VIRRLLLIALAAWIAVPFKLDARQRRWFELYDEAIQHIARQQWKEAETKLNDSMKQKDSPRPGRSVLRYGMLRGDYFPDFYLGVVYLNTARPDQALAAFKAARSQKIDERDRKFQAIATYESQAQDLLQRRNADNLNAGGATPGGRIAEPGPGMPVPPGPVVPAPPSTAELIAVQVTACTQALQKRDLTRARSALQEIGKLSGDRAAGADCASGITTVERAITMSTAERNAMRAFFGGDYTNAVAVLNTLEQSVGGALSGRAYFYRACGLAALALQKATVDTRSMAEARRQYGIALKSGFSVAQDRPYISPRVLQALGSS
jgi:hypothetical protein